MVYCGIRLSAGRVAVPLYEYKCLKCGRRTEKIESVNGPHLRKCPHCGGKMEALISAPAIQFKGSGWYVTDYAGKSSVREAGQNEDKAAEKTESDSKSKEPAAKGSDSKESSTKETKEAKEKKAEKTEKAAKKK
jgi:putative FmdB family regulatory protein